MLEYLAKNRTIISIIICMVLICYCLATLGMIGAAIVFLVQADSAVYFKTNIILGYSCISFALVALVTSYHLYTFVKRRKRKGDQ